MMSNKPDAGTGALFKNLRKEKETHPDYQGDITIRGEKFWLSAWIREGKNGKRYMSLAARPAPEDRKEAAPAARRNGPEDRDAPF